MNLEGANGKNPVYHVGKVYNVLARNIAEDIYSVTNSSVVVDLISQAGKSLKEPWKILIQVEKNNVNKEAIYSVIQKNLSDIPGTTHKIIMSSTKNLRLS